MNKLLLIAMLPLAALSNAQQRTVAPEGAVTYIISPANGATVSQTISVKFGLKNMGIAPAGTVKAGTGHHHLLIDGKELPALDKPMGGNVMHFGGGQTEKIIKLTPGIHTLQLILGDQNHVPHQPAVVSEVVTIEVKD